MFPSSAWAAGGEPGAQSAVQPCGQGRAPWVLRGRGRLPVTAKTAAASSGHLANSTSLATWPGFHTNASVASRPVSQHQRGFIPRVSKPAPVWPCVQCPTASTSVAPCPMSHSQNLCALMVRGGFILKAPQPTPLRPCVQCPTAAPVWPYVQYGFILNTPQPTPAWPHIQCPTACTSVASMSHSQHHCGLMGSLVSSSIPHSHTTVALCPVVSQQRLCPTLMSEIPWPKPMWPFVQCPTASTTVASCPMSHGLCQCGLMPDVPQPSPPWSHVQHPMKCQCGLVSGHAQPTLAWPHNTASHTKHQCGFTPSAPW